VQSGVGVNVDVEKRTAPGNVSQPGSNRVGMAGWTL